MVDGKRVTVVDNDPFVAHAKVMALVAGLIEAKKTPEKITLDQAIARYIEAGEGTLSPATIRTYETMRKNRFPELMQKNVYDLNRLVVQKAVSEAGFRVVNLHHAISMICKERADA